MPSSGHRGNPLAVVGYALYFHDGAGEALDAQGDVARPLANVQVVSVPPSIPFVDWVGRWAAAGDQSVQVVAVYTDVTYVKDGVQLRRVHELLYGKAYYYLDASQGATLAAFRWADRFADIPPPLRTLAKQGREISSSIWHAVYDLAYDAWVI